MQLVRQQHARGCGPAAIAMVTGHSYADVCEWFVGVNFETNGCYAQWVHDYLAEHGFSVQVKRRYTPRLLGTEQVERTPWPPIPFADKHIAQVRVCDGAACEHFVAVCADGAVLDPLCDEPKRLTDYFLVNQVAGVIPCSR